LALRNSPAFTDGFTDGMTDGFTDGMTEEPMTPSSFLVRFPRNPVSTKPGFHGTRFSWKALSERLRILG
jgi:hypothetical protein